MFHRLATIALLTIAFAASASAGEGKAHHVSFHVDQNDPDVMNQTLNNATNVIEYYRGRNEDVDVDIVTYGPGLNMLRSDTSPVQERHQAPQGDGIPRQDPVFGLQRHQDVYGEAGGLPEATMVASGVVHLMELQEQGWSYVRP
jgi:uncharacterized protein